MSVVLFCEVFYRNNPCLQFELFVIIISVVIIVVVVIIQVSSSSSLSS